MGKRNFVGPRSRPGAHVLTPRRVLLMIPTQLDDHPRSVNSYGYFPGASTALVLSNPNRTLLILIFVGQRPGTSLTCGVSYVVRKDSR